MNIDDLKVYNLSMEVGERVWNIVMKNGNILRKTLLGNN